VHARKSGRGTLALRTKPKSA